MLGKYRRVNITTTGTNITKYKHTLTHIYCYHMC